MHFGKNKKDVEVIELVREELMEVFEPYRNGSFTLGYRLKEEVQEGFDIAMQECTPSSDGEEELAVAHVGKTGNNGRTLKKIPTMMPVNTSAACNMLDDLRWVIREAQHWQDGVTIPTGGRDQLQQMMEKLFDEKDRDPRKVVRYLKDTKQQLLDGISLAMHPGHEGYIPQSFGPAQSSRWIARGFNLQSTNRLTRKLMLAGSYSYDVEACHQNLMAQKCKGEYGVELEAVQDYVDNKTEMRIDLANYLGTPIRTIKDAITAIGYGATDDGPRLSALFTEEQTAALESHNFWPLLVDDLRTGLSTLAKNVTLSSNRQYIVNALGDRRQKKGLEDRHIASHILMGEEARVLTSMINAATDPILPVHDGLVCTSKQDIGELEKTVLEETGYRVRIEEEEYPIYE